VTETTDGLLPLRIFEARYLDMVSECLRKDTGFGICLIQAGQEAGEPAQYHEVGTLARITDWTQESDGLLEFGPKHMFGNGFNQITSSPYNFCR